MQGQICRLAALRIYEESKKTNIDKSCAVKTGTNLKKIQLASELCIKYPVLEDISTTALLPLTRKCNLDVQEEAVEEIAKLLKTRWITILGTYHVSRQGGSPVSTNEVKRIINKLKGGKQERYILRVAISADSAYRIDTPIDDDLHISTFIAHGG